MSRAVTLVLVDARGSILGELPRYAVSSAWWTEVGEVVAFVRERYGIDVTVLRLAANERACPPGGAVTYLAELNDTERGGATATLPLSPSAFVLAPHPRRAPYAEPGGPARSQRWAVAALRELGYSAPVTITQRKTWNLSAIWRLDVADTTVWLKQLPQFLAHEPALLRCLNARVPGTTPKLLASAHGRSLLGHTPGEDRFLARVEDRYAMLASLHAIQQSTEGAIEELLALGVPDLRWERFVARVRGVTARFGAGISGLTRLVDGLDLRLAAVRGARLPDTLVHGDFHPGNVRNVPGEKSSAPVILDWGDAFVGNPAFDALRLVDDLDRAHAQPLLEAWQGQWQTSAPGCDPASALRLLRPVKELLGAVVYANFLDNIEPSEWPYHADDVPRCLKAAAELTET